MLAGESYHTNASFRSQEVIVQYLNILYRLSVTLWVGGATLFTFVLTPTIFSNFDRDTAGQIVGALFPGYFKVGLTCGVLALGCLLLLRGKYWLSSCVILAVMLLITSIQAFVIEPKSAALKKEIPSFITTPPEHPLRQQFKKLHGMSAVGNLGVIGGGIALIILL